MQGAVLYGPGDVPFEDGDEPKLVAAGTAAEVSFEPVVGSFNDRIYAAYRMKYHGSPYPKPLRGRSATVKIVPRDAVNKAAL